MYFRILVYNKIVGKMAENGSPDDEVEIVHSVPVVVVFEDSAPENEGFVEVDENDGDPNGVSHARRRSSSGNAILDTFVLF